MLSLTPFSPFPSLPPPRSCASATSQILCSSSGWGFPVVPFFPSKWLQYNRTAVLSVGLQDVGVSWQSTCEMRLWRWRQSCITGWYCKRRWPQSPLIFEVLQAGVFSFPTRISLVEEQMVRRRGGGGGRFLFFFSPGRCFPSLFSPDHSTLPFFLLHLLTPLLPNAFLHSVFP